MRRLKLTSRAIARFYDSPEAEVWQSLVGPGFHLGGTQASWSLVENLGLSKSSRVLEIGAGQSTSARMLARAFGCEVVGVDISHDMCIVGMGVNQEAELTDRIKLMQADAHSLPFAERSFEAVVSEDVWYHLEDKRGALHEAWRVLVPRGRLALTDWVEVSPGLSDREFARVATFLAAPYFETVRGYKRLLTEMGAEIEASEELGPETRRALTEVLARFKGEMKGRLRADFGVETCTYYEGELEHLMEAVQKQHLTRARFIGRKPGSQG